MSKFDDFINAVESGSGDLAEQLLKGFRDEAIADSKAFIRYSEGNLRRWSKLLAMKELSPDDFEWLVMGQKDLAELCMLKETGLGQVRIDLFRHALIALVIDSAFGIF